MFSNPYKAKWSQNGLKSFNLDSDGSTPRDSLVKPNKFHIVNHVINWTLQKYIRATNKLHHNQQIF